jgi:2'-5' RNA ligase
VTDRHRLFVALPVPAWVRADLDAAVAPLRDQAPDLRWVTPSTWHVTVSFLGSVPGEQIPHIAGALAGAVATGPNPTIGLDGTADTFDNRVLWAAIDHRCDLDELASAVRASLEPLGHVEDKPFHAHLTLARPPKGGRIPGELASTFHGPATSWRVDQLQLMRSKPHPEGARYDTVASWPLP